MSAGWIAAGVRGQGLLRRRLGDEGARRLAASPSLASALAALQLTPYGADVDPDMDLAAAQHVVSATVLWHLRVLAGWGPPMGAGPLRVLAGRFEIANVTGQLLGLSGRVARTPYALGSLATAWPAVAAARTPGAVRAALRSSPWGDPGGEELPAVRVGLQLAWARRVLDEVPGAGDWAITGAALVVARALATGAGVAFGPGARRDATHLLGPRWPEATQAAELGRVVPRCAARLLDGVDGTEQLWRAEARWWTTVEASATSLATGPRPDASCGVGVAALLAVDAWRVRAALTLAARGGGDPAEVLDGAA